MNDVTVRDVTMLYVAPLTDLFCSWKSVPFGLLHPVLLGGSRRWERTGKNSDMGRAGWPGGSDTGFRSSDLNSVSQLL